MRWTVRQRAATGVAATIVVALAVLDACAGSGASDEPPAASPSPRATPTASPTPSPSPTVASPSPTPTVGALEPTATAAPEAPVVTGFAYPIEGACLPTSDSVLPNAPREYRAGIHEGVDFYPGLACAAIGRGTPVLAAKAGVVVRADWDFVELTAEEVNELLTRSQAQGYTDADALDRFRGRQVWIDHGGGVVTRYAHLDGIAPGISMGTAVQAGEVVGYVGNSGTPEAVTAPDSEMHLHFEIRVGESYLGAGLSSDVVRALLLQAFSVP